EGPRVDREDRQQRQARAGEDDRLLIERGEGREVGEAALVVAAEELEKVDRRHLEVGDEVLLGAVRHTLERDGEADLAANAIRLLEVVAQPLAAPSEGVVVLGLEVARAAAGRQ